MNIDRVHEINLKLLYEFDTFCKRHGIKYRLDAGTLIGAVRHDGFIPWDDDVDIAMTRKEYNKLLNALENDNFGKDFVFKKPCDYVDLGHFHDFVSRLFYVGEIYRYENEASDRFDGMYRYLWLDIFILDNISLNHRFFVYTGLKIIYALAMGHRYKGYKFKGNRIIKMLVHLLGLIGNTISLKQLYKMYESLSTIDYGKVTEKLIYSNYPMPWVCYETDALWEQNIIYKKFESIELPIVESYDDLLKNLYGDYMKLPCEKERVPAHDGFYRKDVN